MAKSCVPTPPETHNVQEISKGNGAVLFRVLWDWDGTSVFPDCAGPVFSIQVRNTDVVDWYAHLPNKTRGTTVVAIPAGTNQTFTGNPLRQLGLDNYPTALSGLVVNRDPTPT
jgi:hypothetical protein